MYIHIVIHRQAISLYHNSSGVCGVVVIVVGNGHGGMSSNPGRE